MDSAVEKAIHVHRKDGSILKFVECGEGLYVWKNKISQHGQPPQHVAFAQTTSDFEKLYTPRQVQQAKDVRELQRRLAYPPQQRFEQIIKSGSLHNCPFTVDDVKRSYHIYGPIVEVLKGKTTRARPTIVPSQPLIKLPPYIHDKHQQVTLCIDLLSVNGNYFLHTIARNIRFRTTSPIPNRAKKQLIRRIDPVFQQYHSRGFEIDEVLADNEFQCIEADILPTRLNLVSRNEHVGEVENSNKYLKQTVRSLLCSVGARRVPKAMVIAAMDLATTCSNAFPARNGISNSLSPSTIVTGRQPLNFNNLKVTFGSYVQIHIHNNPTNTMQPRTIDAIALNPTGNTQGSYYFMNLDTGQRMSANKWIPCRLTSHVLSNIERLAEAENQPLMHDGPSMFWHTAHGDIPLTDSTDDHDNHQGATYEVVSDDDVTIIDEYPDDSDDSDYEPSDDEDDSDIEYVDDVEEEAQVADDEIQGADIADDSEEVQGANDEVQEADMENSGADEEIQGAHDNRSVDDNNQGVQEEVVMEDQERRRKL